MVGLMSIASIFAILGPVMLFGRGGSVIHLDDVGEKSGKYGDEDEHRLRQLGGKNLKEDMLKSDRVDGAGG